MKKGQKGPGEAGHPPAKPEPLRRRAEEKVRGEAQGGPGGGGEASRLQQELSVHQIELELQNQELLRANTELAQMQQKYFDLFDRAPVAYVTLDPQGRLLELNLTTAILLGQPRAALTGRHFQRWIARPDADTFDRVLRKVFADQGPAACELGLIRPDQPGLVVQFEGCLAAAEPEVPRSCRAVLLDLTARKQAEQALRASEEQLALAITGSGLGLWDWRVQTGTVTVNARWAEIVGYTLDALAPVSIQTWRALCHPEDLAISTARLQAHFAGETAGYECEARMRHKAGHWVWVLDRGAVVERALDGTPLRMTGTHLDITARKVAAEELRRSEFRADQAFRLSPAATNVVDLDAGSTLLDANEAFLAVTGYSRAEVIGRRVDDLNIWVEPDQARQARDLLRAQGHLRALEVRFRRKNGDLGIGLLSAERTQVAGRHLAVSALIDITARREVELAAEARAAQLEALREVSAELTQELDLSRVLTGVLRHALALTGASVGTVYLWEAASQRLVPGAWQADDPRVGTLRLALGEGVAGTVAQERVPRIVNDFLASPYAQAPQLAWMTHRAVLAVPLGSGDRLLGVIALNSGSANRPFTPADQALLQLFAAQAAIAVANAQLHTAAQQALTAQRQAQAELVRTEQLRGLGQMAAGIAHDLNNTLATVLGQVEIAKYTPLPPDLAEVLAAIETAAGDGAATVRRIQEFARPKGTSPLVPCALGALVRETLEITRPRWQAEAQRRGVTVQVTVELPADLPPILAYPPEVREALTNLIFNAVDAMPHGGTLTCRGRQTDTTVTLAVADTGIGMPPEIQAKVFEPFFTTKGVQGTGLGLAVVYGILERHGGHIAVTSTPGQGTTFTLTFRRAQGLAAPASASLAARTRPPARRLLVVDDEPDVRRTLARLLKLAGHQVTEAPDGPSALALLGTAPVDGIITDLGMPEMNGWELARRVKAAHPGLPVLLLTGWQDQAPEEAGERAAVDAVLGKPVQLPALLQAIRELTGDAGS